MKRPTREQLVVLGLLSAPGAPWPAKALRRSGLEIDSVIKRLVSHGLVTFREGLRPSESGYELTEDGRLALRLVINGWPCAWCGKPAVDGRQINGAATVVYFCGKHREIGERSAEGQVASKGSLAGQIRAGKIKPTTPEAVAAAQGIEA